MGGPAVLSPDGTSTGIRAASAGFISGSDSTASPPGLAASASPVDLSVWICAVRFPNPLILASGILGTHAALMERVALAGAGGITAKSAGPVPRSGHANPSCIDFGAGLLNAIGLANPGADAEVALLAATKARLAPLGVPLIASLFAGTVEEFAEVAARLADADPDLIEVNISCPNVGSEMGEPFAASARAAAEVTAAVRRAVHMPVVVKLAPNVPDLGAIARAVVDAGADAICAINTMPGMVIDAASGRPVLANGTGGVSGKALKPVALNAVFQIATAVDVPIIGTGGVSSGLDVVEMLAAGATAVGIGSAVYGEGPAVFGRIRTELAALLTALGLTVQTARGRAHHAGSWDEATSRPPIPHDPSVSAGHQAENPGSVPAIGTHTGPPPD